MVGIGIFVLICMIAVVVWLAFFNHIPTRLNAAEELRRSEAALKMVKEVVTHGNSRYSQDRYYYAKRQATCVASARARLIQGNWSSQDLRDLKDATDNLEVQLIKGRELESCGL